MEKTRLMPRDVLLTLLLLSVINRIFFFIKCICLHRFDFVIIGMALCQKLHWQQNTNSFKKYFLPLNTSQEIQNGLFWFFGLFFVCQLETVKKCKHNWRVSHMHNTGAYGFGINWTMDPHSE